VLYFFPIIQYHSVVIMAMCHKAEFGAWVTALQGLRVGTN